MIQNKNLQFMPQPSAVPYWNMIKNCSKEVKQILLQMLYIHLTEEQNDTAAKAQAMSMDEAMRYLDSVAVKDAHIPSDVNGMRDLCNPKYM